MRRGRGVATLRQLGLTTPRAAGIPAFGVALVMIVFALFFMRVMGMTFTFYPGWLALLPGLFAQAGIAEEVLFRGYLFGHIRVGRTFWRAAGLSMLPFVAVHLVLFTTMPWPIALASVLLSIIPNGAGKSTDEPRKTGTVGWNSLKPASTPRMRTGYNCKFLRSSWSTQSGEVPKWS